MVKAGERRARSLVSKEIFDFEVVRVGLNLAFYYLDDGRFYGIHRECIPIDVKILPLDHPENPISTLNARAILTLMEM